MIVDANESDAASGAPLIDTPGVPKAFGARAERPSGAALESLFHRYEHQLGGFLAQVVRDRSLAEDLLQETFLAAVRERRAGPDVTVMARSWAPRYQAPDRPRQERTYRPSPPRTTQIVTGLRRVPLGLTDATSSSATTGSRSPGTPGLTIVVYTAEPGSRSAEAFSLLPSWAATEERVNV